MKSYDYPELVPNIYAIATNYFFKIVRGTKPQAKNRP